MKLPIAISVGDLNGVGIELALLHHEEVKQLCHPIYCINEELLKQASTLLQLEIPKDFKTHQTAGKFKIKPGKVSTKSGQYSYDSFLDAIELTTKNRTKAVVTLPINKESWSKAGIHYKGHTEVLREHFKKDAIMMLGCSEMFVALFTEHTALKDVPKRIKTKKLITFLLDFYACIKPSSQVALLALNPHASDNGVLGNEEKKITKAVKAVNLKLNKEAFTLPLVPDTAFCTFNREKYTYFVAMYHDQGLIPLKALYFEESINVSLNLPIIRTSVDHGTAFDIAYKKCASAKSYINAIKEAIKLAQD
ncbi:MAG: 4-hydroxythreonine-4-phosphate dehydrogenase [Candidatus Marinarcus sp.]|uniref:4-hydroxythreonine-4-phosphate dehydrogenase n=1 Tax=Candidatus Marinarcus sp. TaxID=3100987 RepID=UPI003B008D33